MLQIYGFSVDYVEDPHLIRTENMRFGWKLNSDGRNVLQESYRIMIRNAQRETVCDTGTVPSGDMCDVRVPGLVLDSCCDYTITVCVKDNHGDSASYETGVSTEILEHEWGDAKWIKPSRHIPGWAPYMRTRFMSHGTVKAVMYASGLGCAEYYVNGRRTDDYYIDPPISNYEKTVFYRRFDITDLIKEGGNAVAVLLGEGFYSQSRVWGINGFVYGDVCARIKIVLYAEDGSTSVTVTDTDNWEYKYSPITINNIYGGETYDARLETPDFCDFGSDTEGWGPVTEDLTPKGRLVPALMPPVRIIRELPAVEMHPANGASDGAWIYDIGENMAGIAEFRLPPSPKGAVYTFRFAEALNEGGTLDFRSIGTFATQCIQQDIYIAKGLPEGETYRPRFCYHGYRYVEVTGVHDFSKGYGTLPQLSLVKGLQLSTDMRKTAEFHTSYEPLERFYVLSDNTYRSNFHGLPEDCPAREKCGWLGDAQIVCNWGLLNYASAPAYEKYLNDIRTTREVFGTWLMISPGKRGCGEASPLWGCAQIIIPYYLYVYCADREAVTNNWDLMEAWVDHELARSDDLIISEGLGDWSPPGGNENPARMPVEHSSTFMFYEICVLMARLSGEFAKDRRGYYADLSEKIKASAIRHFYDGTAHTFGYIGSDAAALELGLCPDGEREALKTVLLRNLSEKNYGEKDCLPTGIYANKYMAPAVSETGNADILLRALFDTERRGFGTMMKEGATTVYENPGMQSVVTESCEVVASYDHPMHIGFMYFCITHIAGIKPVAPGFSRFAFDPCDTDLNGDIRLTFGSVCGTIAVEIKNDAGTHDRICRLSVPAGCECVLDSHRSIQLDGVKCDRGTVIGSGEYEIKLSA